MFMEKIKTVLQFAAIMFLFMIASAMAPKEVHAKEPLKMIGLNTVAK